MGFKQLMMGAGVSQAFLVAAPTAAPVYLGIYWHNRAVPPSAAVDRSYSAYQLMQ